MWVILCCSHRLPLLNILRYLRKLMLSVLKTVKILCALNVAGFYFIQTKVLALLCFELFKICLRNLFAHFWLSFKVLLMFLFYQTKAALDSISCFAVKCFCFITVKCFAAHIVSVQLFIDSNFEIFL